MDTEGKRPVVNQAMDRFFIILGFVFFGASAMGLGANGWIGLVAGIVGAIAGSFLAIAAEEIRSRD